MRAAAGEGSYRAQAILSELQRMHRDAPDGLHFIAFAASFMMSLVAVEGGGRGDEKERPTRLLRSRRLHERAHYGAVV